MPLTSLHPRPSPNRRRSRAAAATEYLLVLAIVVIPLAIVIDKTVIWVGDDSSSIDPADKNKTTLIPAYEHRITSTIILPIG